MPYPEVTFNDVAGRYLAGDAADLGDPAKAANIIADVIDEIDSRFGAAVKSRLASGALTETTFKRVVANVVLRVVRNPDGIYREQLGTYMYQMSQKVASGYVLLMPEEIQALIGGAAVPFGTVDMPVSPLGGGTVW